MRIIAITLARQSQFSPIFDVLQRDHEITLLAPEGTGATPSFPTIGFAPVLPSGQSAAERATHAFLGTACAVAKALRSQGPDHYDVVFGQASFGCTHFARTLGRSAVVSHVELPGSEMKNSRPEFPVSADDQAGDRAHRELVYASLRDSDLVISPSQYARGLLPPDIQPNTKVCMEGFPLGSVATAGERARLREKHGLPDGCPLVGYFGRTLEAVRGFDVFVQVARELRRRISRTAFLVVGEPISYYGKEDKHLGGKSFKDYALEAAGMSEHDFSFRRLQPLKVFRELIASVDVAVFPIFESAGNWSFFECLAVGTPVIAARKCFFPEVIADGENGFLCDIGDIAAFADRCVGLTTDLELREKIGRAGRKTIEREFTIERAAQRYIAAFEEARSRFRDKIS